MLDPPLVCRSLPRPLRLNLRGVLRRHSSELELPPLCLAEQLVVQGRDTLDLRAQLIDLDLEIYMAGVRQDVFKLSYIHMGLGARGLAAD